MANVNIGKVALTPAGDYNSTSTYEKLDIVKDQGSSFIAKKAVPVGTTTGNNEYWQMVASIGATGPTGPQGPIGHTIEWGEIEGNIEDQEDLYTSLSTLNNTKEDLIIKSASGSIVSFDDSADYSLADLKINIDPVQDLHGYDAPWPAGGGKNLFEPITSPITKDGITIEMTSNEEFWVHGTPTIESGYSTFDFYVKTFTSALDKTVTLSISEKTVGVGVILGSGNGNLNLTLADTVTYHTGVYTQGGGTVRMTVRYDVGTIDKKYKIQLEISDSPTAWTPCSNICPITGHTSATVTRTGKNLCEGVVEHALGLTNNNTQLMLMNNAGTCLKFRCKSGVTYTVSGCPDMNRYMAGIFDSDPNIFDVGTRETITSSTATSFTFTASKTGICLAYVANSVIDTSTAIVELGSTATSYEPYQGTSVTIDLNGTRYGGTLNVLTGTMVVDRGIVDLGDANWQETSGNVPYFSANIIASSVTKPSTNGSLVPLVCSALASATAYQIYTGSVTAGVGVETTGNVRANDGVSATKEAFKTAMTGVKLVYPLATPLTVQLTPSQMQTLLGQNNIWADTGDINVKYWTLPSKDITTALDNKLNEVIHKQQQLITNIEPDMKASNNYVIGDLVIVKNKLLRVTQNVSSGSSFIIDSNVVITTIEDELASTYTKTETDNLLNTKANSSSVYTKTETDTLLDTKANTSSVYTKTETDNMLDEKLDTAPTTEMTGDIVMFDAPVDNAIKALSVEIEPVQDLHGYDNPWPAGGGKNLWNIQAYEGLGYNAAVDTVISITESTATVTGNSISYAISAWGGRTFRTKVLTAGTYHFHVDVSAVTSIRMTIYQVDSTDNTVKNKTNYTSGTVIDSNQVVEDGYYLIVYIGSNTAQTISVTNYQIESGNAFTSWSPWENICPISGWDEAVVTRTGKNLFDKNAVEVGRLSMSTGLIELDPVYVVTDFIPVKKGVSYYIPATSTGRRWFYDINKTPTTFLNNLGNQVYTAESNGYIRVTICVNGQTGNIDINSYQIEIGSTATTYEPYQGTSVTIDLDSTRYGGELDVLTGEMTVDRKYEEYDGSSDESWKAETTSVGRNFYISVPDAEPSQGGSAFADITRTNYMQISDNIGAKSGRFFISAYKNLNCTMGTLLNISEVSDWKTYLSNHPLQIVYELDAPITVQLTPTQLSTLLGENHIWADTGNVTLTLRTGAGRMAYQDVVDYDELTNKPDLDNKADVITGTKSGSIVNISDGAEAPVSRLSVSIEPVQDLHGYDNPWPAGGGKNLYSDRFEDYTKPNDYYICPITLPEGNYKASVSLIGTTMTGIAVVIVPSGERYSEFTNTKTLINISGQYFTINVPVDSSWTSPKLAIYCTGEEQFNQIFANYHIQLESGSSATSYAPYSNICPISGWDEAVVTRTGKNLLNRELVKGASSDAYDATKLVYLKSGYTYVVSWSSVSNATSWRLGMVLYDESGNRIFTGSDLGAGSTISKNTASQYYINANNGTLLENIVKPLVNAYAYFFLASGDIGSTSTTVNAQIELGSTATAYEAPSIQTVTINLDGTRYGGTLNVLTGEMTVEYGIKIWTSEDHFNPPTSQPNGYYTFIPSIGELSGQPFDEPCLCNILEGISYNDRTYSKNCIFVANGNAFVNVNFASTAAELKQYLSDNNLNIQLRYKLLSPLTVQLTPSQIQILLDKNYIWANTGDISVNYWKKSSQDLIDGVQELIDYKITESQRATRSIIGGIEKTNIATKNYVVGEYVIVGDDLLKITTNVASGNSLTIGTNCVKTTVAEALIALASA